MLLQTKLRMPRLRPRHVRRVRLLTALNGGFNSRLILVSAPAGFGKTTLLTDWLAGLPIPVGWVSLEASDNDLTRLLRYLAYATRPMLGQELPAPRQCARSGHGPDETILADMVNQLTETADEAVIVLDDYHTITAPAVHAAVTFLLEHLPEHIHLVIATRVDPPFPIARLRARGELTEIRGELLRFTSEEAADFLNGTLGLDLSAPHVANLVARTEGWVAGLQLAGISLHGRTDPSGFIREFTGSHRFVLDYLLEEVLLRQPPDVQAFLLQTAILDRLSGGLCDALTGRTDSQTQLEDLERANLFVVPLDEERQWYRYHPLFADLLRIRLRLVQPDQQSELHRRAARWLDSHGLASDAVAHAQAAGDTSLTGELIERHWFTLAHIGELDTALGWLNSVPAEFIQVHPQLSTAYAWMLALKGQTEGVEERLRDAEAPLIAGNFPPMLQPAEAIPPQIACRRSHLARFRGDPAVAADYARQAIDLIPAGLAGPIDAVLRGDALLLLAHALRDLGDKDAAACAYEDAQPLLELSGNTAGVAQVIFNLVRLELHQGHVDAAMQTCGAGQLDGAAGQPALAFVHLARAEVLQARGDIDRARAEASRGIELGRLGGARPMEEIGREVLAHLDQERSGRANGRVHGALVEPLTDRELEVLRLVAAGRSNQQIACELIVAVGTVKAHVHAICGKLGAFNRVEAIANARRLALLA